MKALYMETGKRSDANRRESPRHRLHLRLAVVYPERDGRPVQPIYHATTHDICMSGLSMLVEDNVFYDGAVSVLLTLPPVHPWAAQKVITITARMTYAIRSSKLNAFKIGMRLLGFEADGKELLQAALLRVSQQGADAGKQEAGPRSSVIRTSVNNRLLGR